MKFVYKHISGKYLKFVDWSKINVDNVNEASIFDDGELCLPIQNYKYVNYEKELRKQKLKKLNEKR